ncbi:hypothetical protein ACFXKC_40715 [Streptomyces sp. NPDC059340]|uniref:hypothetical protein n=1 Tax=Streptomyces sp. NPDC059340 TaxID=3346806 RepID=UPI0036CE19B7
MSQQYPQQPGQPQQQPQWGAPPQRQWGAPPPQPPKKRSVGKVVGLGCLGIIGLFVVIAIIGAVASSGGSKTSSSGTSNTAAAHNSSGSKAKAGGAEADKAAGTVVFKVWGTAPAGALGPADITYGSDSDNRQGHWKNGGFTEKLPFKKDAMYYAVNAQLQGSGDIHCSVTVDGKTKTGHASGGYNICSAQLSSGFSGWE